MKMTVIAALLIAMAGPAMADGAARCAELGALWDRYGARRGEGSSPSAERAVAARDCQEGRYDRGIRTLEEMLRRARVTVPPG